MHPTFSKSSKSAIRISFPHFRRDPLTSQERFLSILSCQIDGLMCDIWEKSDDIQSVLHTEFSHQPGSLGYFADSKSIHWICFAWIRLNPLSGKRSCTTTAVFVFGFTSLIEDLVIRCYQVTKLVCTKVGAISLSSSLLAFLRSSLYSSSSRSIQ